MKRSLAPLLVVSMLLILLVLPAIADTAYCPTCQTNVTTTKYHDDIYHGTKCSVCGTTITQDVHDLVQSAYHESTCISLASTEYKCSYGYSEKVYDTNSGYKEHTVVIDAAEPATCISKGRTQGSHCSVCQKVLVEQESIDPTPHTPEVIPAVAGTCLVKGTSEGSRCKVCKQILVEPVETDYGEHNVVIDAAQPATCTTKGKTQGSHCSVCQKVIVEQESIDPTEHTPEVIPAVAGTCLKKGTSEGSRCKVCKQILVEPVETGYGDHNIVIDAAQPATCTTKGKTQGSHCSVCQKVIVAQESIDPSHSPEVIDAVPGTCLVKGMSEGSRCRVCKQILVEPVETDYGDHIVVSDNEVSATCTLKGTKACTYCSVCNKTLSGGEEIAALGHDWVLSTDGSVSKCSRCTATCSHEQVDENNVCKLCKMTIPAKKASEAAIQEKDKVNIANINAILNNLPELVQPNGNEENTEDEAKAYLVKEADTNIFMLTGGYSEESNLIVGMDAEKMDALVLSLSDEDNSHITIVPAKSAETIGINITESKEGKPALQIETDGKTA